MVGFSALWFSHQCHLNHEDGFKNDLKIHMTFKVHLIHRKQVPLHLNTVLILCD